MQLHPPQYIHLQRALFVGAEELCQISFRPSAHSQGLYTSNKKIEINEKCIFIAILATHSRHRPF